MSEVRVNNIVDYGGKGAPTFDNGAVISGVSSLGNQAKIGGNVTITSGGINVSGVTTAATLSGNLTGDVNSGFVTATSAVIGSGVTINSGGLNITGVVTATSFTGDGSTMTGVAMSITPLSYNPDVNDSIVTTGTGIGITFDHRILAGSGNVTLSIATNAGAAGTTVENFGVGSSVTIAGRKAIISPTSELDAGETYHISYPSGAFTNTSGDVSYVGTAYTFGAKPIFTSLWRWGDANNGSSFGDNTAVSKSSPVQVPGTLWRSVQNNADGGNQHNTATKTDGTLWSWGLNQYGQLGLNNTTNYSSPVQIPGTTWSVRHTHGYKCTLAVKTDGTLWVWGDNTYGRLGQNQGVNNNTVDYSSPVQIPGTTWSTADGAIASGQMGAWAIKTDGTLWAWGNSNYGNIGDNNRTQRSSPTQIPGTTWSKLSASAYSTYAIKTDGTLWSWGYNVYGELGLNDMGSPSSTSNSRSSPTQIPGTTWSDVASGTYLGIATKTDGTLWTWGSGADGRLGQNSTTKVSSPAQIPGTTWASIVGDLESAIAIKTDGTMWAWGNNVWGGLGLNQPSNTWISSPKQIPGTSWSTKKHHSGANNRGFAVIQEL